MIYTQAFRSFAIFSSVYFITKANDVLNKTKYSRDIYALLISYFVKANQTASELIDNIEFSHHTWTTGS